MQTEAWTACYHLVPFCCFNKIKQDSTLCICKDKVSQSNLVYKSWQKSLFTINFGNFYLIFSSFFPSVHLLLVFHFTYLDLSQNAFLSFPSAFFFFNLIFISIFNWSDILLADLTLPMAGNALQRNGKTE